MTDTFPAGFPGRQATVVVTESPRPIQVTVVLVEDTAEPITSADVKAGDHRLLDHPGLCVRAGAVVGEAGIGLAEGVRPAAFGKLRRRAVTRGEPGGPLRQ